MRDLLLHSLFQDKRYRRHVRALPPNPADASFPFIEFDPNTGIGILAFTAAAPNRCVLVIDASDRQEHGQGTFDSDLAVVIAKLIAKAERRCKSCGYKELILRSSCTSTSRPALGDALSNDWTPPDPVRTYYRPNLHGLENELAKVAAECNLNVRDNIAIVSISDLNEHFTNYECYEAAIESSPEICPRLDDMESAYCRFAVELTDGELVGWSIVSRRRKSLLYNRLYIDPKYRRHWTLGFRMAGSALLKHHATEPDTAIRCRVRLSNATLAALYHQYLALHCERFHDDFEAVCPRPDLVTTDSTEARA